MSSTNYYDDNLDKFENGGIPPLPTSGEKGYVKHDGAKIYYQMYGSGIPLVMLHGGLGHGGNWGYQVPDLIEAGYKVVLIDSRGHGRSTNDNRPYSYELMATDVLAVLDVLCIDKVAFVGWSDGAVIALVISMMNPERTSGVFFFGCNMDLNGTKEFEFTPLIGKVFNYHSKEYSSLSSTPDQFKNFAGAIEKMQTTQPNYSEEELAKILVPVTIVQSENDEFIKMEHAKYLANTIPNSQLKVLKNVSHFAPWQRPQEFTQGILDFLNNRIGV